MRIFLTLLGCLSLGTGILGILLPLLPTTPFVLLAAALFARSSPRFHGWLLGHRYFGPLIQDWRRHRAIRPGVRRQANLFIVLSFSVSLFLVSVTWVRLLLIVGLVILLVMVNRLPLVQPVALKE